MPMNIHKPVSKTSLDTHLRTVRLIAEHREAEAELKMLEDFTKCYRNIREFLGVEYAKYAKDDRLTYAILQQKGEYSRFLEEVVRLYDGVTLEAKNQISDMITDTYKLCYQGMVDAVTKNKRMVDLKRELQPIRAVTPYIIKRSVENPIPHLRLSKTLQRSRKKVIAGIKREITVGLSLGDRMSTMARRITEQVETGYKQSILIARTEAHRVREGGFNDAANRVDNVLTSGSSKYRMVKVWKNMRDERVRKTKVANHVDMEGQTVLQDEDFIMVQSKVTAAAPGQSGVATEDCNCRCYVSRDIMTDAEYFAATGKHFDGSTAAPTPKPKRKQQTKPKTQPAQTPTPVANNGTVQMKPENYPAAFTAKGEKKNTQALMDFINGLDNADPTVVELYSRMGEMESVVSEGIPFKISHDSGYSVNSSYYRSTGKYAEVKITIPKLDAINGISGVQTTLHEEMHLMDLFLRDDKGVTGAFSSGKLGKKLNDAIKATDAAIGSEVEELFKKAHIQYGEVRVRGLARLKAEQTRITDKYCSGYVDVWHMPLDVRKKYKKEYDKVTKEIKSAIDWERRNVLGGGINQLEDIYDALSGGKYRDGGIVIYGHGSTYYGRNSENAASEILANYGSLSITRPDLIDMLRRDKPDLVAALDELVKAMLQRTVK